MRVPCEDCGQLVADSGAYQRTSGWVRRREAGGGNAIAMPEREPRFLCPVCLDLRQLRAKGAGVPLSLFED
jgi:hypothetical protein